MTAITNIINRSIPSPAVENSERAFRGGRYGEVYNLGIGPEHYPLVDEGAMFVSTNPTAGTAIAMVSSVVDDAATASSTHAQASPVMVVINGSTPGDPNARRIYPIALRMILGQVPTTASRWDAAIRIDVYPNKVTTAGTLITPVNTNTDISTVSVAKVYFGANTTNLPSTQGRLVSRFLVNPVIPVTLDEWYIVFGSSGAGAGSQISGGTGAKVSTFQVPGIVLGPGGVMTLEMWGTSNAAAPSWEFEFVHSER